MVQICLTKNIGKCYKYTLLLILYNISEIKIFVFIKLK